MTHVGLASSIRPPKLRTFSPTTSNARLASTVLDVSSLTRRKARCRCSHCIGTGGCAAADNSGAFREVAGGVS